MLVTPAAAACVGCRYPLPLADLTGVEGARCPRCQSRQRARVFRTALQPPAAAAAAPEALSGEARCFQHPSKQAAVHCDSCGRFLCTLCQFSLGQRNLCASCIVAARQRQANDWVNRRLNLDTIALTTALAPCLLLWPTLVSGPVAIYLGIRALRQPPGPIPRGRWRAIAAIVLGALQFLAWAALLIAGFGTVLFRGGRLG